MKTTVRPKLIDVREYEPEDIITVTTHSGSVYYLVLVDPANAQAIAAGSRFHYEEIEIIGAEDANGGLKLFQIVIGLRLHLGKFRTSRVAHINVHRGGITVEDLR